jgi:hypothetical protein
LPPFFDPSKLIKKMDQKWQTEAFEHRNSLLIFIATLS